MPSDGLAVLNAICWELQLSKETLAAAGKSEGLRDFLSTC